jgi:hypothetical protein
VLCVHEPELTSVFANREVLVDSTLVPTRNRADSKHNYSCKRLRQGLNIQVAAATDGTLLAVSTPAAGGRHDRRAITECGWEPVLDDYTWYADAAHIGTSATVPFERSKYPDLTGYQHLDRRTRQPTPARPPSRGKWFRKSARIHDSTSGVGTIRHDSARLWITQADGRAPKAATIPISSLCEGWGGSCTDSGTRSSPTTTACGAVLRRRARRHTATTRQPTSLAPKPRATRLRPRACARLMSDSRPDHTHGTCSSRRAGPAVPGCSAEGMLHPGATLFRTAGPQKIFPFEGF